MPCLVGGRPLQRLVAEKSLQRRLHGVYGGSQRQLQVQIALWPKLKRNEEKRREERASYERGEAEKRARFERRGESREEGASYEEGRSREKRESGVR